MTAWKRRWWYTSTDPNGDVASRMLNACSMTKSTMNPSNRDAPTTNEGGNPNDSSFDKVSCASNKVRTPSGSMTPNAVPINIPVLRADTLAIWLRAILNLTAAAPVAKVVIAIMTLRTISDSKAAIFWWFLRTQFEFPMFVDLLKLDFCDMPGRGWSGLRKAQGHISENAYL